MTYEFRLRRAAQDALDSVPARDYDTIARAISSQEQEPRPPRVKKLGESGLWRLRVGQYRIVFHISDHEKIVTVVRVARRREDTYRGL